MGNKAHKKFLWAAPENRSCAYCGRHLRFDEATVDHRTPISRGGSNRLDNKVIACQPCNCAKAEMTEDEFMKQRTVNA